MIGSLAARIVGSSRSSASRRCSTPSNQPFRSSIWIFRSSTSTASRRIGSSAAAPPFCTRVSGSSPGGSVATRDPHVVAQQLVAGAEGGAEPRRVAVVEQRDGLGVRA